MQAATALAVPPASAAPWRRAHGVAALAHSASGAAALAAFAAAYKAKRRLGIDVFPGIDVLPDPQIEAAIEAVLRLFAL